MPPLPDVDYSSCSCSAGAEVELASGVSPEELKEKLRALYGLLEEAVDEQLRGGPQPAPPEAQRPLPEKARRALAAQAGGNGRKATRAQLKAIQAIAGERGMGEEDLAEWLEEEFSVERAEELSVKDASALIDRLKEPSGNGKE
jgi:hypothetical protein